jgi:hypothetical protein
MVPFSFSQTLLKSRVMNKYRSSSATVGVWAPGVWSLELDVFILSCFPAFLILIPVPVFPSFPSVFKNRGSTVSIQTATLVKPRNPAKSHQITPNQTSFLFLSFCQKSAAFPVAKKYDKRLNEPNSKNENPLSNIDDFTNFDFFKK